jgi:hypothetical protein
MLASERKAYIHINKQDFMNPNSFKNIFQIILTNVRIGNIFSMFHYVSNPIALLHHSHRFDYDLRLIKY